MIFAATPRRFSPPPITRRHATCLLCHAYAMRFATRDAVYAARYDFRRCRHAMPDAATRFYDTLLQAPCLRPPCALLA